LNISRIVRVIPEKLPKLEDLLEHYFHRFPK
jgi:hypothetical protein